MDCKAHILQKRLNLHSYLLLGVSLICFLNTTGYHMKTVPKIIDSFTGDFAFLHNFYPCNVPIFGAIYPSAEHAYQASKTTDEALREKIRHCLDAKTAKSCGCARHHHNRYRPDWISVRDEMMLDVIKAKFYNNIPLAKMLLDTGYNTPLLYKVSNGDSLDTYWGMRANRGENRLGIILMHVRTLIFDATRRAAATRLSRVRFTGLSLTADNELAGDLLPTPENPDSEDLTLVLHEHQAANNPDRDVPCHEPKQSM
jgi:N-glycosidase YbiA